MKNMVPQLTNTISLRMIELSMSGTTPTVIYATPTGATLTAAELAIAQGDYSDRADRVSSSPSATRTRWSFWQV